MTSKYKRYLVIIEIATFIEQINENEYFKYFTKKEISLYNKKIKSSLAARYILKKKLIETEYPTKQFTDIEITNNDLGKPMISIAGEKTDSLFFSLSHSKKEAAALILISE